MKCVYVLCTLLLVVHGVGVDKETDEASMTERSSSLWTWIRAFGDAGGKQANVKEEWNVQLSRRKSKERRYEAFVSVSSLGNATVYHNDELVGMVKMNGSEMHTFSVRVCVHDVLSVSADGGGGVMVRILMNSTEYVTRGGVGNDFQALAMKAKKGGKEEEKEKESMDMAFYKKPWFRTCHWPAPVATLHNAKQQGPQYVWPRGGRNNETVAVVRFKVGGDECGTVRRRVPVMAMGRSKCACKEKEEEGEEGGRGGECYTFVSETEIGIGRKGRCKKYTCAKRYECVPVARNETVQVCVRRFAKTEVRRIEGVKGMMMCLSVRMRPQRPYYVPYDM